MGFVWGFWRRVALLFLIVCVVFFPTVACFTVLRCAQLILGKFLIVYRYSVLKSARYLLDYFFFIIILFAWHFRASNVPGVFSLCFEIDMIEICTLSNESIHKRKFSPRYLQMNASKIYLIISELSDRV